MTNTEKSPPQFDHTGLPVGLPNHVYASWVAVMRDLRHSNEFAQGLQRFHFCCGYLQALEDARIIDERYAHILKTELQDLWAETLSRLQGG